MHVYACLSACEHVQRPEDNCGSHSVDAAHLFFSFILFLFLRQGLSLALNIPSRLDRLVNKPQRSVYLHLLKTGIISTSQLFYVGSRIELKFSYFFTY